LLHDIDKLTDGFAFQTNKLNAGLNPLIILKTVKDLEEMCAHIMAFIQLAICVCNFFFSDSCELYKLPCTG